MQEWSEVIPLNANGEMKVAEQGGVGGSGTPTEPYELAMAKGTITGSRLFYVPGRRDAIAIAGLEDISQIPDDQLTRPGGVQLEIVSSSALDLDVTGTGVRSIDVHYLDSSFIEQQETIAMNGTTPALTVATDIQVIQEIHAKTVGSNGVSVGDIDLQGIGAGTVFERIAAGGNQSLSARLTVPANHTGYIIGWHCSSITKKIDFRLRSNGHRVDKVYLPNVFLYQDAMVLEKVTSPWIKFDYPIFVPAQATVKISAVGAQADGDAGCMFGILLVADPA